LLSVGDKVATNDTVMTTDNLPAPDPSNGYEHAASEFLERRGRSDIGAATVRTWGQSLPSGGTVLDLGCGSGVPIAKALVDIGLAVYGVDASPTLCAAFRRHFPNAQVAREAVETSSFFGMRFDAVIAWGLMFLLPAESQLPLVRRVSQTLSLHGRFLFTAPAQVCSWTDVLTGLTSQSAGDAAYRLALEGGGLSLVAEYIDEGENHYYDAARV
jgi:SAM-dependent methyltransferase